MLCIDLALENLLEMKQMVLLASLYLHEPLQQDEHEGTLDHPHQL